jgi:hypothetical protein
MNSKIAASNEVSYICTKSENDEHHESHYRYSMSIRIGLFSTIARPFPHSEALALQPSIGLDTD